MTKCRLCSIAGSFRLLCLLPEVIFRAHCVSPSFLKPVLLSTTSFLVAMILVVLLIVTWDLPMFT